MRARVASAPSDRSSPPHRWVVLVSGLGLGAGPAGPGPRQRLARLLEAASEIPVERTIAVVLEAESPWWRPLLAHLPPENIIEQPLDRGTAPGLILAALEVLRRDPDAELVVATAHADPDLLSAQLEAAEGAMSSRSVALSLRPCAEGTDRGPSVGREASVDGLTWTAGRDGALTLCVAPAAALVGRFRDAQPELFDTLVDHSRRRAQPRICLDDLYPFLPAVDLVRDVFGLVPAAPAFAG